jgi:hypothetical protein
MLTKTHSLAKGIEPQFIEPMYTSAIQETGAWTYEAQARRSSMPRSGTIWALTAQEMKECRWLKPS